jgi:hypothetical protein
MVGAGVQGVPSKLFRIGNICAVSGPFALPDGAYAVIFLVSTMSKRYERHVKFA